LGVLERRGGRTSTTNLLEISLSPSFIGSLSLSLSLLFLSHSHRVSSLSHALAALYIVQRLPANCIAYMIPCRDSECLSVLLQYLSGLPTAQLAKENNSLHAVHMLAGRSVVPYILHNLLLAHHCQSTVTVFSKRVSSSGYFDSEFHLFLPLLVNL
jgi:hypothetical protein